MERLKCAYCGATSPLIHQCRYCGGFFCHDHLIPENHSCPVAAERDWDRYKKEREKWGGIPPEKEPIEIVYEPEKKGGPKPRTIAAGIIIVVVLVIVIVWILFYSL